MRLDKYMRAGMTFGEAAAARRADREANKAAREAQKARKTAQAKTCQCCGRQIFAETGTIAHHGYTRPDSGWQTASCMGAKHPAFEASRDQLGYMIQRIEDALSGLRKRLANVQAERIPLQFHYSTRSGVYRYCTDRIARCVDVTRETFDSVHEAYAAEMKTNSVGRFDDIKARAVRETEYEIRQNEAFLAEQQARYDAWKQTHRFDKKSGWTEI